MSDVPTVSNDAPLIWVSSPVCPHCGEWAKWLHPVKPVTVEGKHFWQKDDDRGHDKRGKWLVQCIREGCGWITVAESCTTYPSPFAGLLGL